MSNLKGYLIEKYNYMPNAYTVRRLIEEAAKRGMELCLIGQADTCLQDGVLYNNGKALEKRDFVINRYKYGALKQEINALCEKQYNEPEKFERYINKYYQLKDLKLTDCQIPKYVLGTVSVPFGEITKRVGAPFMVKGLESSQGREIFLIRNEEECEELRGKWNSEKECLFEQYIAGSSGRDIRFYSIRGEVIACMQRENEDDFRANVARGASVSAYPTNDAIRSIAVQIYAQTGLDFLGIDLLQDDTGLWFCEINVMGGIEGMEQATGVNVAGKMMDVVLEDFTGDNSK